MRSARGSSAFPDREEPEGATLVPEISELPEVSADGRTYTFRIRPGFRFSPAVGQAGHRRDDALHDRAGAFPRARSRRAGVHLRQRHRRREGLPRGQGRPRRRSSAWTAIAFASLSCDRLRTSRPGSPRRSSRRYHSERRSSRTGSSSRSPRRARTTSPLTSRHAARSPAQPELRGAPAPPPRGDRHCRLSARRDRRCRGSSAARPTTCSRSGVPCRRIWRPEALWAGGSAPPVPRRTPGGSGTSCRRRARSTGSGSTRPAESSGMRGCDEP